MLAFACCTYQSAAPIALMLGVTCPTICEAKIPRNYTMGKDPESFPVTYTASPQLTEAAMAVPTWQYWSITDCKKQLVTCSRFRLFTEQGRNANLGIHCDFNPWKCHLRHMSHDRACTVHIPSLQHICHTLTSSLACSQPRWQWLPLRKQMGWGQGAARCTMPRARKPRKQFQMHWCLACNLWLGLEVHETSKTYETTEKEHFGNTDYSSCRSVRFWAFAIWHVFFDLLRPSLGKLTWGRYQPAPAGHSRSTYLGVEYSDATGAKESQPWEHPSVPRSIAVLSFLSGVFSGQKKTEDRPETEGNHVNSKAWYKIYLKWPWNDHSHRRPYGSCVPRTLKTVSGLSTENYIVMPRGIRSASKEVATTSPVTFWRKTSGGVLVCCHAPLIMMVSWSILGDLIFTHFHVQWSKDSQCGSATSKSGRCFPGFHSTLCQGHLVVGFGGKVSNFRNGDIWEPKIPSFAFSRINTCFCLWP